MKNQVDIIIQGNLWECTVRAAIQYTDLDFVNKVYISTWKDDQIKAKSYPPNSKIHYLFSDLPEHEGGNNINYQIISSLNGLHASDCESVVKMRSDQIVSNKSMQDMYDFIKEAMGKEDSSSMEPKPLGPIFTLGIQSIWPYHPQDHILWGYREDLLKFFSLPLSTFPSLDPITVFETTLRANIYLGAHYFALYDEDAKKHIDNPEIYLLDSAPATPSLKNEEVMITSNKILNKLFKPLPKINLFWEKYNSGYPYEFYQGWGEYYHE